MLYTYHYTALDPDGRIVRESEKIDSAQWLDYLRANTERYGNLHDYIAAAFPALSQDNPLVAATIADDIDRIFHDKQPTAVFQYLMYCWDAYKAGAIPAAAWGAALGAAWQAGQRAMLDHVALSQSLVIRMFQAADKEALYRIATDREGWADHLATLPEHVDIYRGVTTAMKHAETGLSWTTDPEQAKQFSGRNVRQASEIPGVLHATVPKSAILAVFELGKEILIDPTVEKQNLTTNYLSGTGLNKFRQNWKKWQAEEEKRVREGADCNL